ncbi:hypothetical protein PSECIP111854_03616 [Pseudoalteromonas sp. CIP111854]|uniref:HEAT repeat domain-containing protein n=1 Tax=Pseudoalteromonas holothuriae TaxID=2963714 RepID=A0A9W4VV55_9GAMM|nr:hypothetical protein [Pseudoalteromonas sp. CIP111854]CAH9065148.1 hypothetical protein PSECIP111854_03616 [Pseudoalteromonas sp. CIP111854]
MIKYKGRLPSKSKFILAFIIISILFYVLIKLNTSIEKNSQPLGHIHDSRLATSDFAASAQEDDSKKAITSISRALPEPKKTEQPERIEPISATERLSSSLAQLKDDIAANPSTLNHAIVGPSNAYRHLRTKIQIALQENPDLISTVIEEFLVSPNSLLGREMSAVLSATEHPLAQQAALDLALDISNNEDSRTAGMMLVANMTKVDGETRDRLLAHIDSNSEYSADMQQFSLMALKPAPSSAEDYARVQSTLSNVVKSPNHDVRRHGVYQVALWATNDQDMDIVRQVALLDNDVNTRARAIMSIAESSFKSQKNRSVLWQVVNNQNEPKAVRSHALSALGSYSLTPLEQKNLRLKKAQLNNLVD